MRILHLTLKKRFFDLIASGKKKEEYREIKPYWKKRLVNGLLAQHWGEGEFIFTANEFDIIRFKNGYSKIARTMEVEFKGITIGEGSKLWGAPDEEVFIISLGKIINKNYE